MKIEKFDWIETDDWDTNLNNYIKSVRAIKLVDAYLSGEDISWESTTNYRAMFSKSTLIEYIFQHLFKEIGQPKATEVINAALKANHMDNVFVMRTFNMAFRHNSIPHNHQYLCDLLTPYIKADSLWTFDIRQIMSINKEFSLPYMKSINNRITKKIAENIFDNFRPLGDVLTASAQNYLIDNNKNIRACIIESGEKHIYPEKSIRDVFIF